MSAENHILSYLKTQGLKLPVSEIQIAATTLSAITRLSEPHLTDVLKIELPIDYTQTNTFFQGLLNPSGITPFLHPTENQQIVFLQICSLMDAVNEQHKFDYIAFYLFPKTQNQEKLEYSKRMQTLTFLAATYDTEAEGQYLKELLIPNPAVFQVAQSGWSRVVENMQIWQQTHQESEYISRNDLISNEMALPVYMHPDDEYVTGVLYGQNSTSKHLGEDAQALLTALAIVIPAVLKNLNWQPIQ